MFRVMIVDDEPTIREGLRTLIEWERLGFRVVDTAANGKEAWDKCRRLMPDLMIVDIRMPGMSGLELLGKIRRENAAVHFMILSGYAEFDYARKALLNRVDGYMLKPVDEDELTQYLSELRQQLAAQGNRNGPMPDLGQTGWNREMLVRSLLAGRLEMDGPRRDELASALGLRWEDYQVLLIGLHSAAHAVDLETTESVRRQVDGLFENDRTGVVFSDGPYIGVLLRGRLDSESTRQLLHEAIGRIVERYRVDFSAAAGRRVRSLDDIRASYGEAVELLKRRFFAEPDRILYPAAEPEPPVSPVSPERERHAGREERAGQGPCAKRGDRAEAGPPLDADQMAAKLLYAIEIRSVDAVRRVVAEYIRQKAESSDTEQDIKTEAVQLVTHALHKLVRKYPDRQESIERQSRNIGEIYRQRTIHELHRYMVHAICSVMNQAEEGSTDTIIRRMVDLIHRNYDSNLKLESLSDVFNYNSAYLGKLFKHYTGEYFNTYVDKVRIEQAKKLLDRGLKVYQVAERVGYSNVDYFHSKFRKYVGISPSSYRKKEDG